MEKYIHNGELARRKWLFDSIRNITDSTEKEKKLDEFLILFPGNDSLKSSVNALKEVLLNPLEKPAHLYGEKPHHLYGEKPAHLFGEKPYYFYGEKPAKRPFFNHPTHGNFPKFHVNDNYIPGAEA